MNYLYKVGLLCSVAVSLQTMDFSGNGRSIVRTSLGNSSDIPVEFADDTQSSFEDAIATKKQKKFQYKKQKTYCKQHKPRQKTKLRAEGESFKGAQALK